MITKTKLKKSEDTVRAKLNPEQIIIDYQIPNGELIRLACKDSIAVIPSDEADNIKTIKGSHIFMDRAVVDKYLSHKGDTDISVKKQLLYEKNDFITLNR